MASTGYATDGLLLDISIGGLYMRSRAKVLLGATASLSFSHRTFGPCVAKGLVERVSQVPRLRGFAIHFNEITESYKTYIEELEARTALDRHAIIAKMFDTTITVSA